MLKFCRNSLLGVAIFSFVTLVEGATPAPSQAPPVHFSPAVEYSSGGTFATSVVVGDFNGDGHPDLAVANLCQNNPYDCSHGILGVLLGNGDGTFQSPVNYTFLGSIGSIATADLNGDGKLDLVILGGYVNVLLGNGDGTFQSPVTYEPGGYGPGSIAVADVNGDGHPDVVVGNELQWGQTAVGGVTVLLNQGDGTLQPGVMYNCKGYGGFVAVRDLNADRKPDIVVTNNGDGVDVLLGNGDGTFQPAVSYDSGGGGGSVAVGDVNRDGKVDLVVANGGPTLGVLLGNGDGTFQPPVVYQTGVPSALFASSVAIGDVNGDNKPDLLLGFSYQWCGHGSCWSNGAVAVLPGNGDGTFQVPIIFNAGPHFPVTIASSLVLTDLNGDGKPDLVLTNYNNVNYNYGIALLFNNFTATTTSVVVSSLNPSFVGQALTFTATVTPKSGSIRDGELVAFYDEWTTLLASVPLTHGAATYTTASLSAKAHYVKVNYPGDATFRPSSNYVKQVVLKHPTTTTLTSSPNPSTYDQTVTLTVTVNASGTYPVIGWVRLWDGTISIGTVRVNGAIATLKKSTLAVGRHAITAQYLGDSYNDKSTSSIVTQVVH